jgi:hypothetical protein
LEETGERLSIGDDLAIGRISLVRRVCCQVLDSLAEFTDTGGSKPQETKPADKPGTKQGGAAK